MRMTLKARIFIDVLQQVIKKDGFGTNKMTCRDTVSSEYSDECKSIEEYREYGKARAIEKGHWSEEDRYKLNELFISKYINEKAWNEVAEAKKWLVDNGYLRQYEQSRHNGGMVVTYTGVTEKGWSIANKYLALIKR